MFKVLAVNKWWVVITPTICIMLLGVYKEFKGEYKRWQDDKKVNATPVKRMINPGTAEYDASNKAAI
jgi:hypothetical protein